MKPHHQAAFFFSLFLCLVPLVLAGISILSFPFTRKPMPLALSCQPQTALASLRW